MQAEVQRALLDQPASSASWEELPTLIARHLRHAAAASSSKHGGGGGPPPVGSAGSAHGRSARGGATRKQRANAIVTGCLAALELVSCRMAWGR